MPRIPPKTRSKHKGLAQRVRQQQLSTGRAKQAILEILRQAEDGLGKTMIFKAFWLAHLYYSKDCRGYLTDWPIVRMPWGPGLDQGERLLVELSHSGDIQINHRPKGPFTEINCRLTKRAKAGDLPATAVKAIRQAVKDVTKHTAKYISELSHEFSRSWSQLPNGAELNIYTDLIPDDVYEERRQELQNLNKAYDKLTR